MIKNRVRTAVFLTLHLLVLMAIFALFFLGISLQILLVVAAVVFSLEVLGLLFFSKAKISRIVGNLHEVEKEVTRVREESMDSERIHRELLYIGHQLKSIQTEMDFLKRNGNFKLSGNGHHKSAHL